MSATLDVNDRRKAGLRAVDLDDADAIDIGASQHETKERGAAGTVSNQSVDISGAPAEPRTEPTPIWHAQLSQGDRGFHSSVRNFALILANDAPWRGAFSFDERTGRILIAHPPWAKDAPPRALTNADFARIAEWMEGSRWAIRVRPGSDDLHGAITIVADANRFDAVRCYLDSTKWDGTPRLATFPERYTSHPNDTRLPFAREAWTRSLIGAVARTYEPGCQHDHVLTANGPQGVGKSTLFRVLAGHEHFTDSLQDIAGKDAADGLQGPWIVELGELDALSRAENSAMKAFVTRRVDRYRSAYARVTEDRPRRVAFFGSTNEETFLRDSTGNRRWWPVQVVRVDIAAVTRDRDQLWAEAVHRYRAGEPWHIVDPALMQSANAAQEERYELDPWEGVIADWLVSVTETTVPEILRSVLRLEVGRWTKADQIRVGRTLTRLGWTRMQRRVGTKREWRYLRSSALEGGDDV